MNRSLKKPFALSLLTTLALSSLACGSGGGDTGGDASTGDGGQGSDATQKPPKDAGGHDGSAHDGANESGPSDANPPDSKPGTDAGAMTFPAGTICNETGHKLTPPSTLKHVLVFLFENENYASVNGNAVAPYMTSISKECGYATNYADNCFTDNLLSCPHYLALTSGSNCDTGLDKTGTGCITDDNDPTSHTLSTTSIFEQVSSWKSYEEDMPSACDQTSSGNYAAKHNPAAYYTALTSCGTNDVPIAGITCNPSKTMTACTAPSNAFTTDLTNDTLPAFAFVTPNLLNDMHNGTVTQGDNWMFTYLPLVLASKAYLSGEMAIFVLWDEQNTFSSGGPTPNFFVSPYITAGTFSSTLMNHFAALGSAESALGISTHLGCASGTAPGGGTCPFGSTVDLRSIFNF
jgi:hypothetical protein